MIQNALYGLLDVCCSDFVFISRHVQTIAGEFKVNIVTVKSAVAMLRGQIKYEREQADKVQANFNAARASLDLKTEQLKNTQKKLEETEIKLNSKITDLQEQLEDKEKELNSALNPDQIKNDTDAESEIMTKVSNYSNGKKQQSDLEIIAASVNTKTNVHSYMLTFLIVCAF